MPYLDVHIITEHYVYIGVKFYGILASHDHHIQGAALVVELPDKSCVEHVATLRR